MDKKKVIVTFSSNDFDIFSSQLWVNILQIQSFLLYYYIFQFWEVLEVTEL